MEIGGREISPPPCASSCGSEKNLPRLWSVRAALKEFLLIKFGSGSGDDLRPSRAKAQRRKERIYFTALSCIFALSGGQKFTKVLTKRELRWLPAAKWRRQHIDTRSPLPCAAQSLLRSQL